ncbi:MAG: 3-deoxy-7-phosphoheptulonate synthase [Acidobacteriota bacterium]
MQPEGFDLDAAVCEGVSECGAEQFAALTLTRKKHAAHHTAVRARGVEIGGSEFVVMAGPCAVESEAQVMRTADAVARAGAKVLRGGAFKPRTSPYAFQGLGVPGLKMLRKAADAAGLAVVTEAMSGEQARHAVEYADIIQIGTRNMENYELLDTVARSAKPVLLKRGMGCRIAEMLTVAEFLMQKGNPNVILCERGIRTFETAMRNTLDIGAVVVLNQVTHLPVIVDPSHAAGERALVPPLCRIAVAAGADGLLVEVHIAPEKALSDGAQSLNVAEFRGMMDEIEPYLELWSRCRRDDLVACRR